MTNSREPTRGEPKRHAAAWTIGAFLAMALLVWFGAKAAGCG